MRSEDVLDPVQAYIPSPVLVVCEVGLPLFHKRCHAFFLVILQKAIHKLVPSSPSIVPRGSKGKRIMVTPLRM